MTAPTGLLSSTPSDEAEPHDRRALVVVGGDDIYEDIFMAALKLQEVLVAAGFAPEVAMGTGRLESEAARTEQLVVLYTAAAPVSELAQRVLAQRVESGVGLVAVHASNVLAPDAQLADLIGSRYASHGPLPHESRYQVEVDADHEITAGLGGFALAHEHYQLELRGQVQVLAWRSAAYGTEPLVHVRRQGKGRVCYTQFGHDMRAWAEPPVLEVVRRAALWAAGGADE